MIKRSASGPQRRAVLTYPFLLLQLPHHAEHDKGLREQLHGWLAQSMIDIGRRYGLHDAQMALHGVEHRADRLVLLVDSHGRLLVGKYVQDQQ